MKEQEDKVSKHPAEAGMKTSIIGIIANFFLGIIKGLAGYIGNSYALVADAIESLSDVAGSFIVWSGLKISTKAPDSDHPYGHGKAEPIASLLVSISLFVAAVIIVVQSIRHILIPHELPEKFTLWILILVILIKELLFKKVFQTGIEIESTAVKSDAWHHRADAITSFGTLIGISIALLGGKGYESADDWAAILTSVFILYNAVRIGKPALSEIMDVAPPQELVDKIKNLALNTPGVKAIDKCYVRKMGFDYYVDIHVVVSGDISVTEGHRISHDVKENLLNSPIRIQGAIIHIEPFDPEYSKK
jgi:cation diffusion facilitator family transporter